MNRRTSKRPRRNPNPTWDVVHGSSGIACHLFGANGKLLATVSLAGSNRGTLRVVIDSAKPGHLGAHESFEVLL